MSRAKIRRPRAPSAWNQRYWRPQAAKPGGCCRVSCLIDSTQRGYQIQTPGRKSTPLSRDSPGTVPGHFRRCPGTIWDCPGTGRNDVDFGNRWRPGCRLAVDWVDCAAPAWVAAICQRRRALPNRTASLADCWARRQCDYGVCGSCWAWRRAARSSEKMFGIPSAIGIAAARGFSQVGSQLGLSGDG